MNPISTAEEWARLGIPEHLRSRAFEVSRDFASGRVRVHDQKKRVIWDSAFVTPPYRYDPMPYFSVTDPIDERSWEEIINDVRTASTATPASPPERDPKALPNWDLFSLDELNAAMDSLATAIYAKTGESWLDEDPSLV